MDRFVRAADRSLRAPGERLQQALEATAPPTWGMRAPGEHREVETDLELKGAIGRSGFIGTLGVKAKPGLTATVERRTDGDLDLVVEQRMRLNGTGEMKGKSARGEGKVGGELGGILSFTQTYTTTDAELPERWATITRDVAADALQHVNGGALFAPLVRPDEGRLAALEQDRTASEIEVEGLLRTQIGAKYGKLFGVESTARDEWVAAVAVEVVHPSDKNEEGSISLTLRLDNDVSLKSAVFGNVVVGEGKMNAKSDVEGNDSTVTLTWTGRDIGTTEDLVSSLSDIAKGQMGLPDQVRVRNVHQVHDFIDDDGLRVAVDGTHSSFSRTTTEITVDLDESADLDGVGRAFRDGDFSSLGEVRASEQRERFSTVGPDFDLQPELKVKGKAFELAASVDLEAWGTELRSRETRELSPEAALRQIGDTMALAHGANPRPAAEARPTLGRGAEGPEVERLQRALGDAGHPVTVDGKFGPNTEAAVRGVQTDLGLDPDGVVGPDTWAKIAGPKEDVPLGLEEGPSQAPKEGVSPRSADATVDPNYGICPADKVNTAWPQAAFRERATEQYLAGDFDGLKGTLRALANGAEHTPLLGRRMSGQLLNRFLDGTGDALRIDHRSGVFGGRPRWLTEAPSVKAEIEALDHRAQREIEARIAAGETSGVVSAKTHVATDNGDGDAYTALGKFRLEGEYRFAVEPGGRTTVVKDYLVRDRYDWDPPNQCGLLDHVVPHALEEQGLAKSFDVEIRWADRQRL